MSTYTQILYQIVFSTKNRAPVLTLNNREKFYLYIWGLINQKNCHLYRINGVEDHLHILTHLHPSVALAALVKDIKVASALYIKEQKLFPDFSGWQKGYGAFTYGPEAKDNLIEYIKNQEQHYAKKTFKEEYLKLLEEHQITYDEKCLF
jgi:REP element-mobilizing transposase RayT